MKKFYVFLLLGLTLVSLFATPVAAAQNGTIVASAVVVPQQISHISFLTSGLVKEVAVQEGDEVKAGQTLAVLDTPELEYNVIAAQEAYRSAEANATLQRYKRVKDVRQGRIFWDVVPPEVRQRADAQAVSAQAAMDAAQATLTQSTLTAPYDATVASVDVLAGEYIHQSQTILTLATLNTLQLETTDLTERDITKVKVGAPVKIFIEALNEDIDGKVTSVSPIANNVGGDIVFKVTIAFTEQPKDILWGMTAEVTIE
jgi:RND family efflux transporter MFP subunit